ncbi:MAG: glycosyltransferase involved in cell wall biosynthesis [Cryomorphaceae bacterium]|jgi:glycosyltransferase involved in cell wall biosynthesis
MRWATYFPEFERIHLTKDVGLIPFYASLSGYDATLLGHADQPLESPEEVGSLQLELLEEKGKLFFLDRAFLDWLKANATETDVLHLFHLSRDSIFYGAYYKRLNPKGKLYLKMDAYNDHLLSRKQYAKNPIKNALLKRTEKDFLRHLDLATIENRKGFELATKTYPELLQKLEYLPNGCNDIYLDKHFIEKPAKEKIVLSVGRLGSSDKNYELFLAALPLINLPEWKFAIVGPISPDFQFKIDEFFTLHPQWRGRITFTGGISDRKKLYDLYSKASVFFLPSRFESFGISFVEALYFGAFLVGHKGMYAYDDISANGEFGSYFEDNDPSSFAEAIEAAAQHSSNTDFAKKASEHGRKSFSWSKLTEKLIAKLDHD